MKVLSIFLPLALSLIATACSYQPEDAGQCKLSCSNVIIGGYDVGFQKIEVRTALPKTTCGIALAGQPAGAFRTDFLMTEAIKDQTGTTVGARPIPNISIEPVLVGARATVENGETDPKYQGLQTPRSNWCSDACGVVSLVSVPLCPAPATDTEYSVQIHSGALYSDPATFSITTEAPAE